MNNAPPMEVDLGAFPLILQSTEAFVAGEGKDAKKLYKLSIEGVLDSFQLSLLMRKIEGHTFYVEAKAPREVAENPVPIAES